MKKILSVLLVTLLTLTLVFSLSACMFDFGNTPGGNTPGGDTPGGDKSPGDDGGNTTHTHSPASPTRENVIEATCKADGSYDEVVRCSVCNTEISRNAKVLNKLSHSYENKKCVLCGESQSSEGLEFVSNNDGTCYVSSIGTCTDTDIVIPSVSPEGDRVTSIGSSAFRKCTSLTSVTIGNSVARIGDYAFSGCDSLTSVTIGNSVTSIGSYAFRYCDSLVYNEYDNAYYLGNATNPYVALIIAKDPSMDSCNINTKTKVICDSAFRKCTSLTSIEIPDSVARIGDYAFSGCDSLTSVTIPDSVTSIGDGAFSGCDSLTSIEIPDSVTSIGDDAFYGCNSLVYNEYDNAYYLGNATNPYVVLIIAKDPSMDSCNINTKTKVIYDSAFRRCDSLTSIEIPDSVTSIGDDAFSGCDSLTSVYITDIEKWYNVSFDSGHANPLNNASNLYLNGKLVTELIIPDGVTSIGDYAFFRCSSLTSVTIPDSVTSIGDDAFSGCDSLTSVTIGNSVTRIGDYAFRDCTSLTSVTIPDSVTSIGDYAFQYCYSLTSVTIGNSVTRIGTWAFHECYKLVEVINKSQLDITAWSNGYGCVARYAIEVHSGDSKIVNKDGYLFYSYNGINYLVRYAGDDTELTLPESYNGENYAINSYAFERCHSLTSIEIPDSVTSIGDYAFERCHSLTSIEIHDSVTSIGDDAFSGCYSLTSIEIPDSVTSIGDYAFDNCDSLTSVTIGNGVTRIGAWAFWRCDSLTSVTIPDSVTSIGSLAFRDCTSLTSVKYRGTVAQWSAVSKGEGWNYNTGNYTITYDYTGE